jgi:hypothetical protein
VSRCAQLFISIESSPLGATSCGVLGCISRCSLVWFLVVFLSFLFSALGRGGVDGFCQLVLR